MLPWDTIKFSHVSFCLIPKVFNTVNVIMFFGKKGAVIDSEMFEFRDVQCIISTPTIGVDNTVRLNLFADYRHERIRFCIKNNLCVDLPSALQKTKNGHLSSSASTPFSFTRSTKITFIQFDFSTKLFEPILLFDRYLLSQFVEKSKHSIAVNTR
jgi:hypothetical protein